MNKDNILELVEIIDATLRSASKDRHPGDAMNALLNVVHSIAKESKMSSEDYKRMLLHFIGSYDNELDS